MRRRSNALDVPARVSHQDKPGDIARSLQRSAERSSRRKSAPFRSAMSLLTFYINRAGSNLPRRRLGVIERARRKLRMAFGKE